MNKIQLFAIAIGVTFLICMLPASPVAAAPAAKKKVAIEVGSLSFYPDYKAFVQKLGDWGFDVVKLYNNNTQVSNLTYTLTGVDILILPMMTTNLTAENEAAVTTWWNLGGKSLWVAGDSDYAGPGGYGAMASHRPNRVLENIGAHIFLEQTAIESTWNDKPVGSIGYRVAAGKFATTGDALQLTATLPSNKSVFHGPTCIIAKNSTDDYVDPLTGTGIDPDVEWVANAVNTTQHYSWCKNATLPVGNNYRVHKFYEKTEYVLMALETFGNGNKLIVSGENPFSTYKNMFAIPTGEDQTKIGSSMTLVYNTIMWFGGFTLDTTIPLAYDFDISIIDAFNGVCLVEWKVFDEWAAQNASGVVGAILYVNDTQKLIAKRTDFVSVKMTAQVSFPMNLTQAIIDRTTFAVIPMDFAGNTGYYLPESTVEYVTITETETSTITKSPGFEMPLALLAFAAIVVFVSRRKD